MPTIKFLFFFCLLSYAAQSSAQNRSATSEEAKAIRQAIENETKAIENCDYEAWASHWAHEDYCYFSVTGPNS